MKNNYKQVCHTKLLSLKTLKLITLIIALTPSPIINSWLRNMWTIPYWPSSGWSRINKWPKGSWWLAVLAEGLINSPAFYRLYGTLPGSQMPLQDTELHRSCVFYINKKIRKNFWSPKLVFTLIFFIKCLKWSKTQKM